MIHSIGDLINGKNTGTAMIALGYMTALVSRKNRAAVSRRPESMFRIGI